MFFQNLPKNIQEAIKGLTQDKEFQDRFGHDPVLDELDDEKNDLKDTLPELLSTLNYKLHYKDKEYNNLTPLKWSFLWNVNSPFVRKSKKEPKMVDADLFFYVLEYGVEDILTSDLISKSFGYCQKNGLDIDDAGSVIHILISRAFNPLKMFPTTKTSKTETEPVFDADWLTSLVSKVHSSTGYAPDYIMNNLSMTACCFYYVQYARMQGAEHIEKRASEEILKAQSERTCTLICDRLIELGVIKEEQRDEIYHIMTVPPEK